MRNINRVEISGNITRDGELRATVNGTPVLTFGVAFNDSRKNAAGEWEDIPNFVDCVMFGTRAEGIAPYMLKGTKVFIAGKLRWSQWEDKQTGQKRSKIEVIIDDIEWPRQAVAPAQPVSQPQYPQQPQQPAYGVPTAPHGYQPQPVTGYQPQAMGQQQMAGIAQQAMAQPAARQTAQPGQVNMYAPPGGIPSPQPAQQGVYDEEIPF